MVVFVEVVLVELVLVLVVFVELVLVDEALVVVVLEVLAAGASPAAQGRHWEYQVLETVQQAPETQVVPPVQLAL